MYKKYSEKRNKLLKKLENIYDICDNLDINVSVRVHLIHCTGNSHKELRDLINSKKLESLPSDMYISHIQIMPSVELETEINKKSANSVQEETTNDDA